MVDSPNSPTTDTFSTESKICYTDPHADVTLVSIEGREFKVQSFWLKANSGYFREHLDSPDHRGEPIKVDAPTRVLKVYLDLCHVKHLPARLIWKVLEPLLKLCYEFNSPSIAERALFQAHEHIDKDPWTAFCLASQHRNVGLAKSALRALDAQSGPKVHQVNKLTPRMADGVSMPYLLGLFNAALGTGHLANGDGTHEVEPSWKVIADRFAPVVG